MTGEVSGTGEAGRAATQARRRNPYYPGPVSDHFDGALFFYAGGAVPRGWRDLLKWQLKDCGSRYSGATPE